MTVKISDCARCGRPAGIAGREHCARCHYALAHRPVRSQCLACGQLKKLQEATGKCVLCSRACIRCGQKIGRVGREICGLCLVKDRRAAAWQPCPRCGKPGRIREGTGWCGHCSHPGRTPSPDAACRACGLVAHLEGDGLCLPCYTKSPHRITLRAGNLAAQLSDPPSWLPGFADYLVPRHNATAACQMITDTGRLLRDGGSVHPQSLLERATARRGPLARALEDFFTSHRLALPPDHAGRRAAARRQRRLDGIPAALRPAAITFADHELAGRQRAQRAGTQPPGHHTIESHLTSVRDFARFLTDSRGITNWATAGSGDIEAFLAAQPSTAAHRLGGLRRFFRFAARRRMILTDPAAAITIIQPQGFTGPSLTHGRQRELFRRWTAGTASIHPHESLTGLLALPRSHHPGNTASHHRRDRPGRPGRHAPRAPAAHPARPVDLGGHRRMPGLPAGTELRQPAPAHHLADQGHPGAIRRQLRQEHPRPRSLGAWPGSIAGVPAFVLAGPNAHSRRDEPAGRRYHTPGRKPMPVR